MFFEKYAYNVLHVGIMPECLDLLIEALRGYEAKTELEAVLAVTMMGLLESVKAMRGE